MKSQDQAINPNQVFKPYFAHQRLDSNFYIHCEKFIEACSIANVSFVVNALETIRNQIITATGIDRSIIDLIKKLTGNIKNEMGRLSTEIKVLKADKIKISEGQPEVFENYTREEEIQEIDKSLFDLNDQLKMHAEEIYLLNDLFQKINNGVTYSALWEKPLLPETTADRIRKMIEELHFDMTTTLMNGLRKLNHSEVMSLQLALSTSWELLSFKDKNGLTPLEVAYLSHSSEIFSFILELAELTWKYQKKYFNNIANKAHFQLYSVLNKPTFNSKNLSQNQMNQVLTKMLHKLPQNFWYQRPKIMTKVVADEKSNSERELLLKHG